MLFDDAVYDSVHFLLTSCVVCFVQNILFLRFCHGRIRCHSRFVHGQCHTEAYWYFVKIHVSFPYPAASSIFSIKIPYPRVGSFTSTCVTAPKIKESAAIPVAEFQDVRTGSAVIRSTVAGTDIQEYSVEILKIYPQDRTDGRNFLIRVTDPKLLETTGGIVQGMSGSPICQNGKIVGAVTHVLVNDPTMGYGIFIENMLDAAG